MLSLVLLAGLSTAFTPEGDYRLSDVTINQFDQGTHAIGQIRVVEAKPGGSLFLEVSLSGMVPNANYNLNIHEGNVGGNFDCSAAKGHFNPLGSNHGSPGGEAGFHLGDFGVFTAGADGTAEYSTISAGASFYGPNALTTGLSFIISEGATDFGQGGDAGSLVNGNSGPRISCGDIAEIIDVKAASDDSTDAPTVTDASKVNPAAASTVTLAVTPTDAPTDPTTSSASSIAAVFFIVVAILA
jgi:Cu-Zn family superoxide dismutase